MKTTICSKNYLLLLVPAIFLSFSIFAHAQNPSQPADQQPSQGDPISQLNLTPEQRQKIRAITQDNRDERIKVNQRLRAAQVALEETLDADSPSDAVVEERIQELSAAQAAQIRMRALTELKIRSVLTPDQIRTWRSLRAERRNLRREMNNPRNSGSANQQNGLTPLFPRTRRNGFPIRRNP
ncbi:MAG TPA: Spy/CpxP family protein refolding chaperone [Pyrinomonadaceae bacterium]